MRLETGSVVAGQHAVIARIHGGTEGIHEIPVRAAMPEHPRSRFGSQIRNDLTLDYGAIGSHKPLQGDYARVEVDLE